MIPAPGFHSRFLGGSFSKWSHTLLTCICSSLPVEHRPSTTPHPLTLFWATLAIPDQLVPCCFSSASVSRLQLLRGRPLFLFPCGFPDQGSACGAGCWGFLRVCPIQPHFLRSVCLATWPSHTSDLKMVLRWQPCQVPGVIGSAPGLVGPVSAYCDWVR